jgi:hypothetical protein
MANFLGPGGWGGGGMVKTGVNTIEAAEIPVWGGEGEGRTTTPGPGIILS